MLTSTDLRVDVFNLQREAKYATQVKKRFTRSVVLRYRSLYFVMPRTAEAISLDDLGNLKRAWAISRYAFLALVLGAVLSGINALQHKGKP
jgi:hypothetical protein